MSQSINTEHLMENYKRYDVVFEHGIGCKLWDKDGNEYLDFLSGISVVNVGHCHPAVVNAVTKQVKELIHVSNLFYNEPMLELADKLAKSSLGGRVYFCNSGAEANEAAIKLARKARPRGDFIVFEGAFHGRTYGALSATPQPSKQEPFAPLVPGFKVLPKDPNALADAVNEKTAAVILEPVQGETGVHPLSNELLKAARDACDRTGALLIFDEIQCGMGRTGTLWAHEQADVTPDLMTVSKSLGGGLPIGALITNEQYADVLQPGDHGSTFAGGPVTTAASLAVLEIIDNPEFLANVTKLGKQLKAGLENLGYANSVRGRGLMLAIDTDLDAPELVKQALFDQRLILNATDPSTVRFLPPLVVSEEEIAIALERLAFLG